MAVQNHTPAFLVFPGLTKTYYWLVKSRETNRTVSRHRILQNAINKAEKLNVESFAHPDLVQCAYEDGILSDQTDNRQCSQVGTVHLIEDELEYCLEHYTRRLREMIYG